MSYICVRRGQLWSGQPVDGIAAAAAGAEHHTTYTCAPTSYVLAWSWRHAWPGCIADLGRHINYLPAGERQTNVNHLASQHQLRLSHLCFAGYTVQRGSLCWLCSEYRNTDTPQYLLTLAMISKQFLEYRDYDSGLVCDCPSAFNMSLMW